MQSAMNYPGLKTLRFRDSQTSNEDASSRFCLYSESVPDTELYIFKPFIDSTIDPGVVKQFLKRF